MKIVVTSHLFLPEFSSGTELIAYNIAKELQSRGHAVTVVSAKPCDLDKLPTPRVDQYEHDGLPVYRFWHADDVHEGQTSAMEAEYNHREFYRWFRDFLNTARPDVVHFIHLSRLSGSAVDACTEAGIPTLFTATDFWTICPTSQLRLADGSMCTGPTPGAINCIRHLVEMSLPEIAPMIRRVPNWLLRPGVAAVRRGLFRKKSRARYIKAVSERPAFLHARMRRIDRVIVPSHTMQELLVRNLFDPDRITRLPYGIHAQHIQRLDRKGEESALRIAFIGQVYEHKGCHVLVEAVHSSPKLPMHLRILGDLTQDPAYVERLRKIAEGDVRIEFVGRFPNDKVSDILKDTDVLVCPSLWYENTPLVIYEAMAAGVPVVASDLPGMAEAIKPEVNGLLFPRGDVTALAGVLRRLEGDRALVARLAANTERPLTVKAHVSELERLYQQVLESRGAAGHCAILEKVNSL